MFKRGITDLLTYTDTPPAAGTYFYAVTAQRSSGESALSNQAKVITAVQLLAHLSLDEGSGPAAADSSGNGRTATLNGAIWATGRRSHAVSLNGSGGMWPCPTICSPTFRTSRLRPGCSGTARKIGPTLGKRDMTWLWKDLEPYLSKMFSGRFIPDIAKTVHRFIQWPHK